MIEKKDLQVVEIDKTVKGANVVDIAVAKDLKEAKKEGKEEKKVDKEESKLLKETPVAAVADVPQASDEKKKEGSVSEPAQLPSKEVLTEKTEKAQKKVEKESVKAKKAGTEVKALKPAVAAAKQ